MAAPSGERPPSPASQFYIFMKIVFADWHAEFAVEDPYILPFGEVFMRIIFALSALLALGASIAPAVTMAAIPDVHGAKVLILKAQNRSGEIGTVTLIPHQKRTEVKIDILHHASALNQPAHIHPGSCANLNPVPTYPLSPVINGKSQTLVNVPMQLLFTNPFAVNIHKSATEASVYVACANIK